MRVSARSGHEMVTSGRQEPPVTASIRSPGLPPRSRRRARRSSATGGRRSSASWSACPRAGRRRRGRGPRRRAPGRRSCGGGCAGCRSAPPPRGGGETTLGHRRLQSLLGEERLGLAPGRKATAAALARGAVDAGNPPAISGPDAAKEGSTDRRAPARILLCRRVREAVSSAWVVLDALQARAAPWRRRGTVTCCQTPDGVEATDEAKPVARPFAPATLTSRPGSLLGPDADRLSRRAECSRASNRRHQPPEGALRYARPMTVLALGVRQHGPRGPALHRPLHQSRGRSARSRVTASRARAEADQDRPGAGRW